MSLKSSSNDRMQGTVHNNIPDHVMIKIQSVKVRHVERRQHDANATLGQVIDAFLSEESSEGRFPTKLSLDLDPPQEEHPGRMDDI